MTNTAGRLTGLTAVVTGAGRGIGRAIAESFAREGAAVAAAARSAAELDEVVSGIQAEGGTALAVPTDITADDHVTRLAEQTLAAFDHVDVLVNNAGVHVAGRFVDIPMDQWYRAAEVNIHGTVRVTRAFLPHMLERSTGRVLNIASTAGKYGSVYQSPYNATKHAVVGLTRCLALETAKSGVRVNAICPGFVATEMIQGAAEHFGPLLGVSPPDVPDIMRERVPIGRFIEPSELAELAVYLASPAADGMTGQALTLAGGLILV